jgi:HSP20 family protein
LELCCPHDLSGSEQRRSLFMEKRKSTIPQDGMEVGRGGVLKGLGDLVGKLGELAETGEELSKTGEIRGAAERVRGVYGFTVKVGLGDEGVHIEPFGNIRRDTESGRAEVQEVREPMVDVFEAEDHVRVLAELPGVGKNDVRVDVRDDVFTIRAERGDKKYRKEILLPCNVSREGMLVTCNNGVLEIKCRKSTRGKEQP